MRFLGNIIWLVFGGVIMGLGWWLFGILAAITIVGLPWARACFVIGTLSFWPFGREVVNREGLTGKPDLGTGPLGWIGNLIWLVCGGFWLAIAHLGWALVFGITIIGIPFALQHLKLAQLSLFPIGQTLIVR